MGAISFQTIKCTRKSDSVSHDTFESILRNLNLCHNEQLDKQNKFYKLRPVISELNKRCLKLSFNGKNKFINESMIPYMELTVVSNK